MSKPMSSSSKNIIRGVTFKVWGGHIGRIVFGGLVRVTSELMSRSGSVLVRMTAEHR
jgi:hypothetical protein